MTPSESITNDVRRIQGFAAIFGFVAVALGAFGTHALKKTLNAADLQIFQTGVQYHLMHAAVALFAASFFRRAAVLFLLGITIFSGSLYVLSVFQIKAFGAIAPIGGTLLMAGWIALAVKFFVPKDRFE